MTAWSNYDEIIAAMRAEGFDLAHLDIGKKVRVKRPGHSQKGWYVLHEITLDDGTSTLIGAWGYWLGAEAIQHKIKPGKGVQLTPEQRAAIETRYKAEMKREAAERARKAERAAHMAAKAWRMYVPDGASDYLARKGVQAHGLRYAPSGNGTVAVPMMDASGRIHGLQIIRGKDRGKKLEKEYWPSGLDKKGHYHLIGGTPRGVVIVCEGEATGASLHEATGLSVAVAFDAGNLTPVAQAISKAYRGVRILICGDDDYRTSGNPGLAAAQTASATVGGAYLLPVFAEPRPEDRKGPTDFNDLHALEGLPVVRAQVEAKLAALGALDAPTRAGARSPQGGGETTLQSLHTAEEAAERWTLIYGGGGTMFDHREHILVPKSDVLDLCVDRVWSDWKRLSNRKVVKMTEVGFDPAEQDAGIKCNLWGGWPTTPKAGRCDKLLDLLRYLCGLEHNESELYDWVLKWIAYPIQHPGAKMKTALIFHGPQGAGKNLFFEAVMAIYGEYGRIVDQAAIEDKFNDWASRKLFLIGDEVVARQELFHMKNKLKALITGDWIRINPKNVAAHEERNHVNLVFLSNEKQPLVIEPWDRRYTVIWTPDKLPEHFYREVADEIRDGGVAALHHHLKNLDLGDFGPHAKPIHTQARQDLIEVSLDSVERFVRDWIGAETPHPFMPCASMDLYKGYTRWCRDNGVHRPRESNQFLAHIAKLPGWSNKPRHKYDDTHYAGQTKPARMVIPSTTELEKAGTAQKADKTQAQWLTDCFFDFRNTLEHAP